MKLYTEEQLITCYNKGLREGKNNVIDSNLLYGFLPIELPSDEEIEKAANDNIWCESEVEFYEGAKWVIEHIKQQATT